VLRLLAVAVVALLALITCLLQPDPGARRASLLLVALGLGYGHQLGALWFGRRRGRSALELGLRACTLLTAGVAFAIALGSPGAEWLILALAALAAWHVFENDRALAHASPAGVRLPPLARRIGAHLPVLLATAAAVAVALAAPRMAPALVRGGMPPALAAWTPEEVIALLLLHHVLVFAVRSAVSGRRAAILGVHLLPVAVLGAVQGLAPAAFVWLASPILYLFLSAAHAVWTSLDRGLERPA
jgi:hypothetical protein